MTKFFKKSKKTLFWGRSGPFFILAKMNFPGKKSCQFLNISIIIVPLCEKSEKTNESFLRKTLNRKTDNSYLIGASLGRGSNYQNNFKLS